MGGVELLDISHQRRGGGGRFCDLDAFECPGRVWLVAHNHVTAAVVTMLREISSVHFR